VTPGKTLQSLHAQVPLVHCITNYVAMNIAANVTLAAGASPAMLHAPQEVAEFVPMAGALTINIGTLSDTWVEAMMIAAQTAQARSVPWVLDPVAHFVTTYRAQVAKDLLAQRPSIVRGNASEIIALAGGDGAGKGADSGDSVTDAQASAIDLASRTGCVVAVTGPVDFATDGQRHFTVRGGSDLMPKVTALGCSLTALVGAYAAVTSPLEATAAALLHFSEAGERAARSCQGPGSFTAAFLDQLHALHPDDLDDGRMIWL